MTDDERKCFLFKGQGVKKGGRYPRRDKLETTPYNLAVCNKDETSKFLGGMARGEKLT